MASNVRRLRREQGLSQEALADRAGIHRTYLGSVERAERNVAIDNICRIAWALGVHPRGLLAEPEEGEGRLKHRPAGFDGS